MRNAFTVINFKTFLIVIIIAIVFAFLKIIISSRRENRITKYALEKEKNYSDSLSERINNWVWKVIQLLSKILIKSKLLLKSSKKYEKYILYEESDIKQSIDYLSIKVIISFVMAMLYIITKLFQNENINIIGIVVIFVLGFLIPNIYLKFIYNKKRKEVSDELLRAIVLMNGVFKSGGNIMQAISIVKDELSGAISDEFSKIYMDLTYGLSIEVVFARFYERIKLDDVLYIASSLSLLNKTGGNIVKVFSSIEKSFYNKRTVEAELKAMTSSSIMIYKILIFFPFIFSFIIVVLNKDYFKPLLATLIGRIILFFIIMIYILYIITIKRILKVEM